MMRRSMTPVGTGHERRAAGLRAARTMAALGLVGVLAVAAGTSASATGWPGGGHGGKGGGYGHTKPVDQGKPGGDKGADKGKPGDDKGKPGDQGKPSGKAKSTGLYVYPKDDPNRPAAWMNSGRQVLVSTWVGWSWKTTLEVADLPEGVCGPGWGVQQDQVWGDESILPDIVDRKKNEGVLGWPPVHADLHSELGSFLTVPDCGVPTPPASPTPPVTPTTPPAPTPTPTPTVTQPEPRIEVGEWVDGEWPCDATTVERTRVITTTPYVLTDGAWTLGEPQEATERGMRDLTDEERTVCPAPSPSPSPSSEVLPAEPSPSPTPSSEVLAASPSPSPTYTSEVLAAPSGSGGALAATGSTVGPILGGAAALLLAGAGLVLYRRRAVREDS